MESSSGGHNIPKIMVFRPTMDEFKDFSRYIEFIELQGAHKAGLAKVIPPKEWIPRRSGYGDIDITIPEPILQSVTGNKGLYTAFNVQKKAMQVKDYEKLANDDSHRTPRHHDLDDLERKFWKNVTFNPPLYGADMSGSLYDADQDIWNINRLGTILDRVSEELDVKIEGVNTAYLYFGMWKSSFCWHTEDMDLYSINYLHYGAPKSWYAIPPEHGRRFERLAAGFFPNEAKKCPAFLRHKYTHISPNVLRRYSIPVNKITQNEGEFMITFPYSYHAGYNNGYNCAESTNFATVRWIEYGKRCLQCTCEKEKVSIQMECFVKLYQPERYELWKAGLDNSPHPEDDQSKLYSSSSSTKVVIPAELLMKASVPPTPPSLTMGGNMGARVSRRHSVAARELSDTDKTETTIKQHILPSKPFAKQQESYTGVSECQSTPTTSCVLQESLSLNLKEDTKMHMKKRAMEEKDQQESKRRKKEEVASSRSIVVDVNKQPKGEYSVSLDCNKAGSSQDLLYKNVPYAGRQNFGVLSFDHTYVMTQHADAADKKDESLKYNPSSTSTGDMSTTRHSSNNVPFSSVVGTTHTAPATVTRVPFSSDVGMARTAPATVTRWCGSGEGLISDNSSAFPWQHHLFTPTKTTFAETSSHSSSSDEVLGVSGSEPFVPDARDDVVIFSEDALYEDVVEIIEEDVGRKTQQASADAGSNCWTKAASSKIEGKSKILKKNPSREDFEVGIAGKKKGSNQTEQTVTSIQKTFPQLSRVARLFQFLPQNQTAEIEFNRASSLSEPFCDVCSLISNPMHQATENSKNVSGVGHGSKPRPAYTKPAVPDLFFQSAGSRRGLSELTSGICDNSQLLMCSVCHVGVHASCYGELRMSMNSGNSWKCERCLGGSFADACCLCLLRGGALKRTTTGQWAHVVCALLVAEASFDNPISKGPIRIDDQTSARRKLKCAYCLLLTSGPFQAPSHSGASIQCTRAKCCTSFHVTCGRAAGAKFELSRNPDDPQITVTCTKHGAEKPRQANPARSVPSIVHGEHVVAKHKNGRYYRCRVNGVINQLYFRVGFEDGSFSNDTYPEDIEFPPCSASSPPPVNCMVKVRWSDGLLYDAVFKGTNLVCLYQIQFEDGSVLNLERKDIWSEREELPKKVLSRMSVATETKHQLFDDDNKELSSRTRSVPLRYIRDQDFINP